MQEKPDVIDLIQQTILDRREGKIFGTKIPILSDLNKTSDVDIFHQALINGELDIVRRCFDTMKFPVNFHFNQKYSERISTRTTHVDYFYEESMTPLHIATYYKHLNIVRYLLEKKADANEPYRLATLVVTNYSRNLYTTETKHLTSDGQIQCLLILARLEALLIKSPVDDDELVNCLKAAIKQNPALSQEYINKITATNIGLYADLSDKKTPLTASFERAMDEYRDQATMKISFLSALTGIMSHSRNSSNPYSTHMICSTKNDNPEEYQYLIFDTLQEIHSADNDDDRADLIDTDQSCNLINPRPFG